MNDLRFVLRQATRKSHERVDALFGTLDLAQRQDYSIFLASHRDAFEALAPHLPRSAVGTYVEEASGLLKADMASLGLAADRCSESVYIDRPFDPLGVQYVLGGASFGKRVLHRRWAASTDAAVLCAGAYLSSDASRQLWEDFLARSENLDGSEQDQRDIVGGANTVFDVFAASFAVNNRREASISAA